MTDKAAPDLLCFSHLRWDFVFQRPQHLLSRAARTMRVFFFEEPVWEDDVAPSLRLRTMPEGVLVVQPVLPNGLDWGVYDETLRGLVDTLVAEHGVVRPVLWFYTPHALAFAGHLPGHPIVYDCMDELSAFKGADPALPALEAALMARADLVFTGGHSLFEAKRKQHGAVHCFPSGVDTAHFSPARTRLPEPVDLACVPRPRAGFYGVLDERLDWDLLAAVADQRPDVQFVMVGPLAKIEAADLPRRANIHYLGGRAYAALPGYLAHWDVALMPFALNAATRYISPTKTPEYLAGGRQVVSTPVHDVVRQYGGLSGVRIAATAGDFAAAIDDALALQRGAWLPEADAALAGMSWDATWAGMQRLITGARLGAPAVMRRARYDVVVVGAGFAGAVMAERRVLVADRRAYVGGNAYDAPDAAGVLVHPYGPHIFHTNSETVFDYLSRFTAWRRYEHRVLARVRGMLVPMPINRTTVNRFFGRDLAEHEVGPFLASLAEQRGGGTAEDVVVGAVGRELYEAFFRGYTRKQWGMDPSALDGSVTARVPARASDDDRYFQDRFQAMPLHGYTPMFERMLDHPGITVATETDWTDLGGPRADHVVFTGPVDAYFGMRFGPLPYRSLVFRHETHDVAQVQPVAVINEPDEAVPHTRTTEFKHLTGQVHGKTSLCVEYPADSGDPYYPVPKAENQVLYRRYQALADATPGVTFVGRLATYRYYNMDQVVAQALATYRRMSGRVEPEVVAAE
jgi:UDP-galactopyranose mutase